MKGAPEFEAWIRMPNLDRAYLLFLLDEYIEEHNAEADGGK